MGLGHFSHLGWPWDISDPRASSADGKEEEEEEEEEVALPEIASASKRICGRCGDRLVFPAAESLQKNAQSGIPTGPTLNVMPNEGDASATASVRFLL